MLNKDLANNFIEKLKENQESFLEDLIEKTEGKNFKGNNLINKILEENMGMELLNTLLVYINKNGERNKVAKELHIHRNTLNYRLNKIEEITGLSFNNYIDLREYINAYIEYFQVK